MSTQEVERNTRLRLVFLSTLLSRSNCFLRAYTIEYSTVKASLFVKSNMVG